MDVLGNEMPGAGGSFKICGKNPGKSFTTIFLILLKSSWMASVILLILHDISNTVLFVWQRKADSRNHLGR